MYFNRCDHHEIAHSWTRMKSGSDLKDWLWLWIQTLFWRQSCSETRRTAAAAACQGAPAATACRLRTWRMSRNQCGRFLKFEACKTNFKIMYKSAKLDCLNLPLLCKTNLCHCQGVSKLGGRLSGMASGVMSSIQVGFEIQMVFGKWSVWSVWKQNPCQSYIVLSESETGQLVVWFRYLAVEWCFSTFQHPPTDFLENTLIFALVIDLRSKLMKIIWILSFFCRTNMDTSLSWGGFKRSSSQLTL